MNQYSVDIQRELGAGMAFKIGYLGSRGSDIWLGGTNDSEVNINQLDPSFLSLGSALNDPVANPFFGNSAFGSLADGSTLPRGQLLRPYPHFRDVWAHHISEGKSSYNALRLEFEKKFRQWGARVNYTMSSYKSNMYREQHRVHPMRRPRSTTRTDLEHGRSPRASSIPRSGSTSTGCIDSRARTEAPRSHLGGWSASVIDHHAERVPADRHAELQYSSEAPSVRPPAAEPGGRSRGFGRGDRQLRAVHQPRGVLEHTGLYVRRHALHRHRPEDASAPQLGRLVRQEPPKSEAERELLLRFEFINFFGQANFNGQRIDLRAIQLRCDYRSRRIPAHLPVHGEGGLVSSKTFVSEGRAPRPALSFCLDSSFEVFAAYSVLS